MPTPVCWQVPTKPCTDEARVAATRQRLGKLHLCSRTVRAKLVDDSFPTELAAVYDPRGTAPLPAALLAMVTILQAFNQVAIRRCAMAARRRRCASPTTSAM